MSSGSSNIDPNEFNEVNTNATESESRMSRMARVERAFSSRALLRSFYPRGMQRRRRMLAGNPYRIWIYQPANEPRPNRQAMNRIIFSIGRALRTRRSVPAQPGLRPGVIYRRDGDVITIDVERQSVRRRAANRPQ